MAETLDNTIIAEVITTMVATIIGTVISVVVIEVLIRTDGTINVNVEEEQRSGIKIDRNLINRYRYVSLSI